MGGYDMKRRMVFFLGFVGLLAATSSVAKADLLNEASAWYCTISGNKGAVKISFRGDGTFTGVGAISAGGIVSIQGSYALNSSSKQFSGNCRLTGPFLTAEGSFSGKLSSAKSVSFQILLASGTKYKLTGSITTPNVMPQGFFDCSIKGADKGSCILGVADSGIEDVFRLEGVGATEGLGRTSFEISGYGDSKGNVYGQWRADGTLDSTDGTLTGKYQGGKISLKARDAQGRTFTIQSTSKDMSLKVPFETNRGSTCLSSSLAMVLQYYKTGATFDDVFAIFGLPPGFYASKWIQFENWIETFGLAMITYDKATIEDVLQCVYRGLPVVVLQHHHDSGEGHDRVVIGYNLAKQEFILNDPSNYGPGYRMSFDEFDSLWNFDGYGSTRLLYLIIPKTSQNPLSDVTPYLWY
jgi:hypothetical protein